MKVVVRRPIRIMAAAECSGCKTLVKKPGTTGLDQLGHCPNCGEQEWWLVLWPAAGEDD